MANRDTVSLALSFARRRVLILAGAVFLVGPAHDVRAASASGAASDAQPVALKTVVIPVDGMACFACAAAVKDRIKSLAGVSHVDVSLAKGGAGVTYEPDKLSPDTIVAAINALGYKAETPKPTP